MTVNMAEQKTQVGQSFSSRAADRMGGRLRKRGLVRSPRGTTILGFVEQDAVAGVGVDETENCRGIAGPGSVGSVAAWPVAESPEAQLGVQPGALDDLRTVTCVWSSHTSGSPRSRSCAAASMRCASMNWLQ